MVALDETSYAWRQRFGFALFAPDDPTTLDVHLQSGDIQAMLADGR